MNTRLSKMVGLLATMAALAGAACGGDDSSTTPSSAAAPAEGTAAAQPAAGSGPAALQIGAAPAALQVPIPPSFDLTVAAAGEYQIDVTSTGSDPRVFLYQGESWVEDDDDGGEGTNARIVRFLTPGTYSVRVVELRARTMAAQVQARALDPLTPAGALTLGQPSTVQFPAYSYPSYPEDDRAASKALTLTIAAAGQYSCTATMDNDRRAKIALIQGGNVLTTDDHGYNETNASITQQLQPGAYVLRVWDSSWRGETNATVTCNQG
jgi:hypothetical protein